MFTERIVSMVTRKRPRATWWSRREMVPPKSCIHVLDAVVSEIRITLDDPSSRARLETILDDRSVLCSTMLMSRSASQDASGVRDSILDTGRRVMAGKGFSAVGLNEILTTAGVPKGSFYHYFGSKEAFGEAMLAAYFEEYLAELDEVLRRPGLTMAQRLIAYFQNWRETQSFLDCQGKCLAVKLGAEVADLSEAMRGALGHGTSEIVRRLERAIEAGIAEGSLSIDDEPTGLARSLYQLWLGASVMVKIVRGTGPFDSAMTTTRKILHLPPE